MQERKLTLIDIGAGALPSVTPVTAQNSSWFPTVYVSPETPPVDGVTPEPVADGVLIEWDAVDQAGVVYIIERGPAQDGPWTEIHRTTETRYLYSDGSGQKWYFRITASVRGKPGQGTVVEATPAPTTAELISAQQKLDKEIVDRALADANEAAARARDIGLVNASLVLEAQTRVTQIGLAMDAIADEGQTRATDLLNEKLEREAAITAVSESQQSGFDSLSRALSEVAAGSGTQFDSRRIWDFNLTTESWTGNGAPALVDGWLRPANAAANPYVQSPAALAIDGNAYRFVKMRIRKVGNPTWSGALQWITTTDAAWNTTKRVEVGEPAWDSAGVATIDVPDIAWRPATIAAIRLQLGAAQGVSDYYLIDWLAIGRPMPGASVALVQEETQARVTAIAAEASQRNTLAVQMRGDYAGSDLSQAQGFVGDERTARVAADAAQVQRITTMEARMPAGSGGLATSASVTTLQDAMVAADQANAQATTAVNSKLTGLRTIGDNLLPNSNFADNFLWWVLGGNSSGNTILRDAASGDGGPGVTITRGTAAQAPFMDANDGVFFPVQSGTIFRARVRVKLLSGNGNVLLRLIYRNAENVQFQADRTINATVEWTDFTVDYGALPAGSVRALFRVHVHPSVGTVSFDKIELYDVTDQTANQLNAAGLQSITTRTGVIEGTLVAQGSALTQVQADVAGKASNAALTSLDSKVTQLGNTVTSQATALTSVNAQLAALGEVKSYQITSNGGISTSPSGSPRASGIRIPSGGYVPGAGAGAGRGFSVCLINADGSVGARTTFDTYADVNGNSQAMADFIATVPENQYFIVYTSDSVGTLLPGGAGAAALRAALVDAGGTTAALGSLAGSRMYILIGRRKLGGGAGMEVLSPAATSARLDLWCEFTLQVLNGLPIGADDKRSMAQALDATVAATSTLTGKVTALEGTTTAQGQAITTVNAQLAATQQAGPNILIDGGFEAYAADGLIYQAGTGTLRAIAGAAGSRAYVGARAARLLRTGAPSNTNTDTYFGPEILTNEGRVYFVEAWLKSDPDAVAPGGATYSIGVTGINSAGVRAWYSAPTTGSQRMDALANWTKISGYVTISNPTVKAQLWATIQGRNGQTPQNVALLIDNVMWQDVTDAYGAKATADAAATGLSALSTTVTQQGGQISAQATQLNQVQASLSGKAEASVVASMSAAVASIGRGGNLITNSTFPQWQRNGWGWYSNPHGFRELGDPTSDPQWSPTGVSGIGSVVPGVLPNGYDGYFGTEYFIGIDANRTYCVSGYMSNHRCSMALYAEFYDRAGNIVGNISCPYTSSAASAPVTLNNLSRQFAIGKAPANAASARIICRVVGTGENQPYFWLFRPMFSEVGDGATTPPPWSAGGTESSASWQVMMNTDGYVSGLQLTAKGQKSAFNVLASAMNILSPGGADGIEMTNGYLRVWRGNSQRIIGNGFGNGGEGLIDYFGPNVGAVAASKANATVWMDVNGNAYWGGSLAAGVLRNAVQSTQISTVGTQVVNGPFGSNGRNKSVVVGFSREVTRRKNQYSSQGFVAGAGNNTCTINVYRKVENDPETFWTSFTAGGGVGIYNESDGPDIATSYWSGSVTLNDNIDGSRPRQYRAEIVGYSEQAVTHQSGNFDVQTTNQSLSIVSTEV